MFDTIAGLPLHPLVIHVVVMVLPLSALGLIAVVLVERLRPAYSLLAVLGLGIGGAAAFVAKESGEALARRVGDPGDHAKYGDWLVPLAIGCFVVAALWWFSQRRSGTAVSKLLGVGVVALSIATVGLTVLVGHSGATAVWAASGAGPSSVSAPSSSASSTPAPSSSPSASSARTAKTYSLADVAKHSTRTDCWAAIDGGVYRLTTWISQHPGGADRILAICGKDGSSAFDGQHTGNAKVAGILAGFRLGSLSK